MSNDSISRQAAIEAIDDWWITVDDNRHPVDVIKVLPSAQPEINVTEILRILIEQEIYKDDYEKITSRILEEDVKYETAIEAIKTIIETGIFDKV